jgi:tripartite-type tricarboxylate transporter receptor subunit TctC
MERGEVDGMCGISYSTLKSRFAGLLQEKSINLLVQATAERDSVLAEVPSMAELAANEEDRAIIRLLVGTQRMARPFLAPPDLPRDRKQALREAFNQTTRDPDFVADAKKQDIDVAPMTGAEIDSLLRDLYSFPKEVAARAAVAMAH